MLKKVLIGLAVVYLTFAIALFYPQVYVMRGNGTGVLYWNADRALLVMDEMSDGAHMSYVRYGLEPYFFELGQDHKRNDLACLQVAVIQITDKDVQTFKPDLLKSAQPECMGLELFDGDFYAVHWPILWKWSGGTSFERPTHQEYGAYATAFDAGTLPPGISSKTPWLFDDVDGWSMRTLGYTKPPFDITLAGQPVSIMFHGRTWPPAPLSIDLIRPGQPPQMIWSFDESPHRVSKAEYYRVFPPQD